MSLYYVSLQLYISTNAQPMKGEVAVMVVVEGEEVPMVKGVVVVVVVVENVRLIKFYIFL